MKLLFDSHVLLWAIYEPEKLTSRVADLVGAQGGKSRSTGKAAAARANGALGGRPRRLAAK